MTMRIVIITCTLLMFSKVVWLQGSLPILHDSLFNTYYHQKVSIFNALPTSKDEIIFIGNSITDSGEWTALFRDEKVKNMGISGDISAGVIHRIGDVAKRKPNKIFLHIGTNDLARGISTDSLINNILLIATYIKNQSRSTKLFVLSILPVSDYYHKFAGHTKNNEKIISVNNALQKNATEFSYTFIDIHSSFKDKNGNLKTDLSNDGLHPMGAAYHIWKHIIYPYVYDVQLRPSLIPMPKEIVWKNLIFPLYHCSQIVIDGNSIQNEAKFLQDYLKNCGWEMDLVDNVSDASKSPYIELKLGTLHNGFGREEGYQLNVTEKVISIIAETPHGIFNGIQTLKQLCRNGSIVDGCNIADEPAFSWRGYMIDVGRNYMSPSLLKKQIDVMAGTKMNVFHFHATEDIAWRIQIEKYPELTQAINMQRNKGMFYSTDEIKELIDYCKKRHIIFVPEIDMPGHSAAFTRALGVEMQSDSGMVLVKNILKEFCTTYDVPYVHIGADEVKITNQKFIPEVTALIESYGKKVIGWQPGGNFNDNTIRQLWMENNDLLATNKNLQLIDSRHLYLNHMDPMEAVTTIFFRKIGNRPFGDNKLLGATLCLWHDRAVSKEEDMLLMNPVLSGILAFAERSWVGGGVEGWLANIGSPNSLHAENFAEFERRLMDMKSMYGNLLPFQYIKQSDLVWQLFGPYKNHGDVTKKFEPELIGSDLNKMISVTKQVGATIIFRHWWAPMISSVLEDSKDSTTWYASTKIWREDNDGYGYFWIGFYNFSRSQAPESPPKDKWDQKTSKVWVNGHEILPPKWKRAGQKGDMETPLVDEGYEFREPTAVFFKKGWNNVLIKAPVGSLKPVNWHNPIKWMFTFVKSPNE